MSFNTLMTTERDGEFTNGTNVLPLPMRLQEMSDMERQEYQGMSAYDYWYIHSTNGGPMDILRGDALIDYVNIDPLTSKNTFYRVIGLPRNYDNCYYKIPCGHYITSRNDGA